MKRDLILIAVVHIILAGCKPSMNREAEKKVVNFGKEVTVNRTGELYTVAPAKIFQVLPFRGNIPAIDKPRFVTPEKAEKFLKPDDEIIGINFNGIRRAYSIKVLRWHQIVNDDFGGVPLLVAYDPISDMGVAYERTVLEKTVEFEVSDKVYNSNPLYRDRETKTYWSQFGGEAILGRLAGQKLEEVQTIRVPWCDWRREFPNAEVLSLDTGVRRNYDWNVYEKYYKSEHILFEVENEDGRLKNKERVYGLRIGSGAKAYKASLFNKGAELTDKIGGVEISIFVNENGLINAKNNESGDDLLIRRMFWFAWAAFNPATEIYGNGN